ncbi:hypothetical protein NW069_04085 [Mycoplasmopsis cynos]|uniref:hypothetical protein n=1 Tax=Mycoplasmopsis cynos TaxID=171284 RepID=UPI00220AE2BC|nr:hypothetical protein [Mycoplasmopsis cynos]UWV80478.1 hypothetical protein NW069_04085 [Mycoplasmopsis cynos]
MSLLLFSSSKNFIFSSLCDESAFSTLILSSRSLRSDRISISFSFTSKEILSLNSFSLWESNSDWLFILFCSSRNSIFFWIAISSFSFLRASSKSVVNLADNDFLFFSSSSFNEDWYSLNNSFFSDSNLIIKSLYSFDSITFFEKCSFALLYISSSLALEITFEALDIYLVISFDPDPKFLLMK